MKYTWEGILLNYLINCYLFYIYQGLVELFTQTKGFESEDMRGSCSRSTELYWSKGNNSKYTTITVECVSFVFQVIIYFTSFTQTILDNRNSAYNYNYNFQRDFDFWWIIKYKFRNKTNDWMQQNMYNMNTQYYHYRYYLISSIFWFKYW